MWTLWDSALIRASTRARFHTTLRLIQPPTAPEICGWLSVSGPSPSLSAIFIVLGPRGCTQAHQLIRQSEHQDRSWPWLTQLTRWETRGGRTGEMVLQQKTARGSGDRGQPALALPPAALPSPMGWCWRSWSYAAGQNDPIQQKYNVTTNQKIKQIYTLMGMVPSLVSVRSLQTPLLVPGSMREHSAGEQKEEQESMVWCQTLSYRDWKINIFSNFWSLHLENCKYSSSTASSLGFAQHTVHRCRSIGMAKHSPELLPQALSGWRGRMWGGNWAPAAVQIKGALQRKWKQTAQGVSGTWNHKRARRSRSRSVFQDTQALSQELWNITGLLGTSLRGQ